MNKPRKHLRLTYRKKHLFSGRENQLEASRKRLAGLALSASLAGAGCGDFEPILPPDAAIIAPMVPPNDSGEPDDVGEVDDAGFSDAGDHSDLGATDQGFVPPMPPPSDTGVPPRDTGTSPRDTGTSPRDTGVPPRDTGTSPRDTGVVPPMPPPQRDSGRPLP